jgi:hypothetical protein
MDALCDPRAFLSAQEKRAEQLKALGIEETDISKDVIQSKGPGAGGIGFFLSFCVSVFLFSSFSLFPFLSLCKELGRLT